MEKMSYIENPYINEEVSEIIEKLKDEIIYNFHPKTIILSGSFGRGEGTVLKETGKIKILSDCEIILIPYWYVFNRNKINDFESKFYERNSLKVDIWGASLSFYLSIPFMNKKMKSTINNYDLKYGSKVIYGKNYLERVPNFKPDAIPLWEGIRLLFNRMAEALEHFSFENPSESMVFWTDKIVLACQDALLLSLGKYHHSYRKRNEMFQNLFLERFGGLEYKLPNFLELVSEATERKLNGGLNVGNPVEYWFDVTEICDKVFRYVIRKEMGIEFGDYLEFREKYLKHPKIKTYSRGFFSNPIYQNFVSFVKMFILSNKIPSTVYIKNTKIPCEHVVYSTIPLIYNSVLEESTLDFGKNLQDFASEDDDGSYVEFNYVKEKMIEKWKLVR
jgi:hypothetical protein